MWRNGINFRVDRLSGSLTTSGERDRYWCLLTFHKLVSTPSQTLAKKNNIFQLPHIGQNWWLCNTLKGSSSNRAVIIFTFYCATPTHYGHSFTFECLQLCVSSILHYPPLFLTLTWILNNTLDPVQITPLIEVNSVHLYTNCHLLSTNQFLKLYGQSNLTNADVLVYRADLKKFVFIAGNLKLLVYIKCG